MKERCEKMMSHTPGPWKVTAGIVDNPCLIVEDDIGNPVCAMSLRGVYGDTVKMTANAALIAAAPDLKEALEWYAENVLNCRKITAEGDKARHDLDHDGGKRARMALEKARGEV